RTLLLELREAVRVAEQAADAEWVLGGEARRIDHCREIRDRVAGGGFPPGGVAPSCVQVTRPTSGSCCPMDATSGRVRSMLIFQYIRLRPPCSGAWGNAW